MLDILVVSLSAPLLLLMGISPLSEALASVRKRRPRAAPSENVSTPRLLILVPAHNEEIHIGACVRSLMAMDYPVDSRTVVVIADNCADGTAALAREEGALCWERQDTQNAGKPYALDWALRRVPIREWDCCVIIDADTTVEPSFARALSARAPLRWRCIQTYIVVANEDASAITRMAAILHRIRYERTYPAKQSAGLNSPLTGNGMCIGSEILAREGWPAFSLTENWELYAHYTAEGVEIEYEGNARIHAHEEVSLRRSDIQRRRWLAGRLWVLGHYAGKILRGDRIEPGQKFDALAELASLSPALHLASASAVLLLATTADTAGIGFLLAGAGALTLLPMASHTTAILSTHPRPTRLIVSFAFLPFYAVWRVLTALRTVETLRSGRWLRTERS